MPNMFRPRSRRQHPFSDYSSKKRFAIRLGPTSLVLTTVLLALLVFGIYLPKNFANIVQPISLPHNNVNSSQSNPDNSSTHHNQEQTTSSQNNPLHAASAQQPPPVVHSSNDTNVDSTAHIPPASNSNTPANAAQMPHAPVSVGNQTVDMANVSHADAPSNCE